MIFFRSISATLPSETLELSEPTSTVSPKYYFEQIECLLNFTLAYYKEIFNIIIIKYVWYKQEYTRDLLEPYVLKHRALPFI